MNHQAEFKKELELIPKNNSDMDKALLALEELKSKIIGDPRCGRYGCYGRGYTGYDIIPDKSIIGYHIYLHPCRCVKPFETEYSRLMKHMENISAVLGVALEKKLNEKFTELHNRELKWKINNLWQKIILVWKGKNYG